MKQNDLKRILAVETVADNIDRMLSPLLLALAQQEPPPPAQPAQKADPLTTLAGKLPPDVYQQVMQAERERRFWRLR